MLNRRLIRIKTFKILYSAVASGNDSLDAMEKELMLSCEKTRDLYFSLLGICGRMASIAEEKIAAARNKFRPTDEEKNPNMKFLENGFLKYLESSGELASMIEKRGVNWTDQDVFLRKTYASMTSSDYYAEYMSAGESSMEADCKFFRRFFEEEFEDNELLEDILEDISVYWVDDIDYVLNVILHDIDELAAGRAIKVPSVFIKDEDRTYAKRLLEASFLGYDRYRDIIAKNVEKWSSDRFVSTDVALIVMGLAEAETFDTIPVKVTINEYVEISKYYSTSNSRVFVNGLLDKLIQKGLREGVILKNGRGLFES